MSTFTEWNGPAAGRGASTKDVLALIDAYNQMNALLSKHIESTATDDVHKFNTALQEAVTTLENATSAALSAKADKTAVEEVSSTVATHGTALNTEVSRAKAAEAALESAIDAETSRASSMEADLQAAIETLEQSVDDFIRTYDSRTSKISFDDDITTTVTGVLAATQYFIGKVKVRELVDFVDWKTFNAQFAGTGAGEGSQTHGVYILGMLSEDWDPDKGFPDEHKPKGARVYVKYVNDRPFDLVVDLAASGLQNGAITCNASFYKVWSEEDSADAWEDMALHLLMNTDSSGKSHVYLGISARGLYGQSTAFHVAGENFIPGGTVNGVVSSLGFTRIRQGFNAYRAHFDDLRLKELHDNNGSPILRVEYYQDALFQAHKNLYIADTSFSKIHFMLRPSVLLDSDELDEDGHPKTISAPVLTSGDIDGLSAGASMKGIIVFWPQWEDATVNGNSVKRAINVPEGWIACDGSVVSTEEYPTLIEILGLAEGTATATLPCMDYAIMRLYNLFDNVELSEGAEITVSLTNEELTDAMYKLQDGLTEEAMTRESADNTLQANIDAEAAARVEADNNLQANLNTETEQRIEADNNLQANLNTETEQRLEADANLQTNINIEANARVAADDVLQANIDAEAQARQDADNVLQANIDAEAQARDDADGVLGGRIDGEVAARIAADNTLQANISTEETARTAADAALGVSIDAIKTSVAGIETTVAGVSTIATSVQSTVEMMKDDLANEITERKDADQDMQDQIDALEDSKAESWTGSQAEFDAAKGDLKDGTVVLSDEELTDT